MNTKKNKKQTYDYKNYSLLKNYARNFLFRRRFRSRLNHNSKSLVFTAGKVTTGVRYANDQKLIERLKKFYIICDANFEGNKNSVWSGIFMKLHGEIHAAFVNSDEEKIIDILRNPGKYNLFYGFENLCRDLINARRLEDILEPELTMDSLLTLCEAVGVIPVSNPESLKIIKAINPETAIELLEKEFGFELCFPNPFEGENGLATKRGIISYRAIQALYQAWRISGIVKGIPKPRLLEIGGGLGRTAYYCHLFGIHDYTIADIPMSSVSQGNFLGRVLLENDLILSGEPNEGADSKIKLIHTNAFFSSDINYDLIVNVDSLTELDISIAKHYLKKVGEAANMFLSINHENNPFTINSIYKESSNLKRLYRNPYWLRRGYVEELFNRHIQDN